MVCYCKCNPKLKDIRLRKNPSSGNYLLLCENHADMHDEGYVFEVIKHPTWPVEWLNDKG